MRTTLLTLALLIPLAACGGSAPPSEAPAPKAPTAAPADAAPAAAPAEHADMEHGAMYSCPMHPEETSDKPGACSKCGMDLVKGAKAPDDHKSDEQD